MFKIKGKTIHLTRGDIASIKLSIPLNETEKYEFQDGDKINFIVKKRNDSNGEYMLNKEVATTEGETVCEINLTSQDTSFGPAINKPSRYWYEINLNGNQTIVGYDENGAKDLILYPELDITE